MFNGPEYKRERDYKRLKTQHDRIKHLMLDGKWRTLNRIAYLTNDPESSISAQLRHLRKTRFGGYNIQRKLKGNGLYKYRIKIK